MRTESKLIITQIARSLCCIIGLIGLSLVATPVSAQAVDAGWIPIGPDGGLRGRVVLHPEDPTQLFVFERYVQQPLYYSADRGDSWQPISETGYTRFFFIEPYAPYRLIRGASEGVLVSAAAGDTWQPLSADLETMRISGMQAAPSAPGRLYAHTLRQALRSDDGGATWQAIGTTNFSIFDIIVSPLDEDLLFITTEDRLLHSQDGGRTWQELDSGLNGPSSLVASPFDRGTLYASTWRGAGRMSTDAGISWRSLDVGSGIFVLHPTQAETIFFIATTGRPNNLFISEDGGANWRVLEHGLAPTHSIDTLTIDPTDPADWYASASVSYDRDSLFRSDDGGASWQPINNGIRAQQVERFTYSADRSQLYAATEFGFFRRDQADGAWTESALPARSGYNAKLDVDAADRQRVFLLTQGSLFRTDDSGESWSELWPDAEAQPLVDFIALPTTPTTLIATPGAPNLWISRDGGESWQQTLDQPGQGEAWPGCAPTVSLAHHPTLPATVYFFADGEVFRSQDGGASWRQTAAFPAEMPDTPNGWCSAPMAVEADTGMLWLGSEDQIWRSDDEGVTWRTLSAARFRNVRAISLAAAKPGAAAVVDGGRILVSHDGGITWAAITNEPNGPYPQQIELAPDAVATLTASFSADQGLFTRVVELEALYLPLIRQE